MSEDTFYTILVTTKQTRLYGPFNSLRDAYKRGSREFDSDKDSLDYIVMSENRLNDFKTLDITKAIS